MFDLLVPVLIFLLTAGIKEFFARVLSKEVPPVASVVIAAGVSFVVIFANALGGLIPAAQLALVGQIVAAIVAMFGAFGVRATVRMFSK